MSRTLCCSSNCIRRQDCKTHCINNEGTHYVEDWSNFGSANYTDSGCEINHWCGELGKYKMFEPIITKGDIYGKTEKEESSRP